MKFCSACGGHVQTCVPPDDNRPRWCCVDCKTIHYQNPKLVVGTIPVWQNQVLLCRRAIEPRYGFWTLPAGFLENEETTAEGALRETDEEAGARVNLIDLHSIIDVLHVHQVHLFYRAQLLDARFSAGSESLEVRLFKEAKIPWPELAFRSTAIALQNYFADRSRSRFTLHISALTPTDHRLVPMHSADQSAVDVIDPFTATGG